MIEQPSTPPMDAAKEIAVEVGMGVGNSLKSGNMRGHRKTRLLLEMRSIEKVGWARSKRWDGRGRKDLTVGVLSTELAVANLLMTSLTVGILSTDSGVPTILPGPSDEDQLDRKRTMGTRKECPKTTRSKGRTCCCAFSRASNCTRGIQKGGWVGATSFMDGMEELERGTKP